MCKGTNKDLYYLFGMLKRAGRSLREPHVSYCEKYKPLGTRNLGA